MHTYSETNNFRNKRGIKLKRELQDTRKEIYNPKNMFAQFLENQNEYRSRHGEWYHKNKESYRKLYSPTEEVFHSHHNMDNYRNSSYPRKDFEREAYPFKSRYGWSKEREKEKAHEAFHTVEEQPLESPKNKIKAKE